MTAAWKYRIAMNGTLRMAGDLETLHVDVLSACEIQVNPDSEPSEYLCKFGAIGYAAAATTRVVLSENARVLGWSSGWNFGVHASAVAVSSGAPHIVCVGLVESDPPGASADDDGISACNHPCAIAVAVVIPEIAIVVEGAVLIGSLAVIGGI